MALSTSGGGTGGALAEINVTPLVDVMLVLLIVFMVTAPMLQTGVDVDLPDAKAQTLPDDTGKLVLTIRRDKTVYLGKMQIPWEKVEETLRANERLKTEREIYLHADENLLYKDVISVMAILKLAGADKLGMITDPLE